MLSGTFALLSAARRVAAVIAGTVNFAGATINGTDGTLVRLIFSSDGSYSKLVNGVTTSLGNWIAPQQGMDQMQVRLSLVSGDAPTSGSGVNTWLSLGSLRSWTLQPGTSGRAGTWKIEVARISDGTILKSANFVMGAA